MSLIDTILFSVAVWRISHMMVHEDGPFRIFYWIHLKLDFYVSMDDGSIDFSVIPDGFLPSLFSCVWCMSMWVSFAVVTLWVVVPHLAWVLLPFTLSGFAILFELLTNQISDNI